jgi:hypothetical protein
MTFRRPFTTTLLLTACTGGSPSATTDLSSGSDESAGDDDGTDASTASDDDGTDADEASDDADDTADTGSDTGDPPGCGDAPCPACTEGAVDSMCECGDTIVTGGFCCTSIPFDSAYAELTGGCPAGPWYVVDGEHPDASDDNPGTADAPWLTIDHAVDVAVAGDTVIIEAATYRVVGTATRYEPALNPTNSGSAGAPIVFKGHGGPIVTTRPSLSGALAGAEATTMVLGAEAEATDGIYEGWFVRITSGAGVDQYRRIAAYDGASRTVSFSQPLDAVPSAGDTYDLTIHGPILGVMDRHFVVWDGMTIEERDSYAPDTGPVVWWGSNDGAFIGNDIVGQTTLLQDNHNGLRVNNTSRLLVRNNRIHGVQPIDLGENNPQNHAAIMIYESTDCVFEHNELYDSFTGFYPKGEFGPHAFRNNVLHDLAKGVRISYHTDVDIEQNLFYDCDLAFQPAEEIGDVRIHNNVFFRSQIGIGNWFPIEGITVFNNLFYGVAAPFGFDDQMGAVVSDHNVYFEIDDFSVGGRPVGGLAGWQAMGLDAASSAADPGVVDAEALDFHPTDGSILPTAGIDWADRDDDGDTEETIAVGIYVVGDERVGPVQ